MTTAAQSGTAPAPIVTAETDEETRRRKGRERQRRLRLRRYVEKGLASHTASLDRAQAQEVSRGTFVVDVRNRAHPFFQAELALWSPRILRKLPLLSERDIPDPGHRIAVGYPRRQGWLPAASVDEFVSRVLSHDVPGRKQGKRGFGNAFDDDERVFLERTSPDLSLLAEDILDQLDIETQIVGNLRGQWVDPQGFAVPREGFAYGVVPPVGWSTRISEFDALLSAHQVTRWRAVFAPQAPPLALGMIRNEQWTLRADLHEWTYGKHRIDLRVTWDGRCIDRTEAGIRFHASALRLAKLSCETCLPRKRGSSDFILLRVKVV